jgi:FkbM family methyltransferase
MFKILLKSIAKFYLGKRYYNLDRQAFPSFSQMGEDMIVRKIFEDKIMGFYVDVGAYHPKQYSNTYYFYLNGWRGINIEAMPGKVSEFNNLRPRDINIESGISDNPGEELLYIFDQPALNTFSKKIALKQQKGHGHKMVGKRKIKMRKLGELLNMYLPVGVEIDFLNVDVEGLDYSALKSNDWNRYIPKVIAVEDFSFKLEEPKKSKIYNLLISLHYELYAITNVSLIFKHRKLT